MKRKLLTKKLGLLMLLSWLLGGSVLAQNLITGVVKESNGMTLPGVTVVIKGSVQGTITDMNGTYSMKGNKGDVLQFSFIGFKVEEVEVGDETVIDVIMMEDVAKLDEVVVTGYGGTRKRSKLTNSIVSVKEEILSNGAHANPAQALTGAVSGLKVTNTSGKPGATPSIVLRGGTEFNGTGSPLILVDGQVRSSLSDINPQDIESMEVLKDAGATALYGARANNGVILVKTKQGKSGASSIEVVSRIGLDYYTNSYEFMNGADYLHWVRNGYVNANQIYQKDNGDWAGYVSLNALSSAQPFGTGNKYFDDAGNPLDGNKDARAYWSTMFLTDENRFLLDQGWKQMTDPVTGKQILYEEFDWEEAAFNQPALTQDYNINFQGGNERGNYYASLGYYDREGTPVETWYKRLNFTFNGEYAIKEWIKSTSKFQFSDAKWYDVPTTSEGNYFGRMLSLPPTQRKYNPDGELILGKHYADGNPNVNIDKFKRDYNNQKFNMSQGFKVDLLKNLYVNVNAHWFLEQNYKEAFNKDYQTAPGRWNTSRNTSAQYDKSLSQTYNAVVNYDLELGEHTASALLGYEFFDKNYTYLYASGSGAPTDDFGDLGLTSSEEGQRNINTAHSRERIRSYFGRVNYDFNDKYLLSATFRRDGYSRLLGDNRWGFFPGVSAGWVVNKESFMADYSDIISFMKLRASYGLNGNVSNIGVYELQGSYSNTTYNNQVGYLLGSIPNPGLKWERSKTFEVGLDISFLKNTISSNFTYYNRLTLDKYANIPLPVTSGISSIRSNNGEFRNKGIEIDLAFKVLRINDLKWDINANIAHNVNIIEKLPDNGLENNRQSAFQVYDPGTGDLIWVGGYQEGQRPGDVYGFKMLGVYKDWDQVNALAADRVDSSTGWFGSNNKPLYGPNAWAALGDNKGNGMPIVPGDAIWKDVNGDGNIDNHDLVKLGNTTPKWFGGFNSNTTYKNLSLSIRLDYALGFVQVDHQKPWFMAMAQGTYNSITDSKNTWTPENTNAKYPEYRWADQLGSRNYARKSSQFIYDGDYLAFREISLSYKMPQDLISKVGLQEASLSVTGKNLGYWTKSELNRPELQTEGSYAGYPLPKTVLFGVNLKF